MLPLSVLNCLAPLLYPFSASSDCQHYFDFYDHGRVSLGKNQRFGNYKNSMYFLYLCFCIILLIFFFISRLVMKWVLKCWNMRARFITSTICLLTIQMEYLHGAIFLLRYLKYKRIFNACVFHMGAYSWNSSHQIRVLSFEGNRRYCYIKFFTMLTIFNDFNDLHDAFNW